MHTTFNDQSSPIILSVAHDGGIRYPLEPILGHVAEWQTKGLPIREHGTRDLALKIARVLDSRGIPVSTIFFELSRVHADPNRRRGNGSSTPGFEESYLSYHAILAEMIRLALRKHGYAFLLDLHGFSTQPGPEALNLELVLGTNRGQTTRGHLDQLLITGLTKYRYAYSPDKALRVGTRMQGGHIVRSTTDKFGALGLDAVQLEIHSALRDSTRQHAVAKDLATALETVVRAMSIGRR